VEQVTWKGGEISIHGDTKNLTELGPEKTWSNFEIRAVIPPPPLAFGISFPESSPTAHGKVIAFSGHKHLRMPGFITGQHREHI